MKRRRDYSEEVLAAFEGQIVTLRDIKVRLGLSDNEVINAYNCLVKEKVLIPDFYTPNMLDITVMVVALVR